MKTLLASTTALLLATSAYADGHSQSMGMGDVQVSPEDFLTSNLIGMRLYASDRDVQQDGGMFDFNDGYDDIGDINNVVVTPEGEVAAVIAGIGGFLAIGEKDVAISMDEIGIYHDEDGERFLVISATQEALENLPTFEMPADDMAGDGATVELAESGDEFEIEREGFTMAAADEMTTEELTGTVVYSSLDENVGEISELLLDDNGQITSAIVDVGGWLGMGEKPVELPLDAFSFMREDDGEELYIVINKTEEELESMPNYEG